MEDSAMIHPKKATDRESPMDIKFNTLQWERFEKLKEKNGFSNEATAARYFLNLGMRAIIETDPRTNREAAKSKDSVPKVRDYVPEGKENAVDLKDELPEIIAENMLDIAEADDKINRDGFEVWR